MSLVDWIYPRICVGCGREGEYICFDCQKKLRAPEAICPMCCKASLDGWVHPRCKTAIGINRLIVGLPYRGMVQECLKKVKYKSSWEIINFLFRIQTLDVGFQNGVITSVPMWREKERERGFNQAEMIAVELVKSLQCQALQVKYADLLERVRETKPMFGLDRQERRKNIVDAFVISKRLTANGLQQNRAVLVDDVWTTGATMRECAKVLKMAGVREVWGVTLAR